MSAPWRYARRFWTRSIPIQQRALTISPSCFKSRATSPAARPRFERALAIREKALGPERPWTAQSFNNLANLLKDQGDLAGCHFMSAHWRSKRKCSAPSIRIRRKASTTSRLS
ncbi:MAG: hypothetical protein DLM68_13770 [Hyphomicrobiales bacterium]|nr:MAG: hypothetical protein DLM68_13770 [Hyphomicrobiales bacterium]